LDRPSIRRKISSERGHWWVTTSPLSFPRHLISKFRRSAAGSLCARRPTDALGQSPCCRSSSVPRPGTRGRAHAGVSRRGVRAERGFGRNTRRSPRSGASCAAAIWLAGVHSTSRVTPTCCSRSSTARVDRAVRNRLSPLRRESALKPDPNGSVMRCADGHRAGSPWRYPESRCIALFLNKAPRATKRRSGGTNLQKRVRPKLAKISVTVRSTILTRSAFPPFAGCANKRGHKSAECERPFGPPSPRLSLLSWLGFFPVADRAWPVCALAGRRAVVARCAIRAGHFLKPFVNAIEQAQGSPTRDAAAPYR
jgi:hypothetical protein